MEQKEEGCAGEKGRRNGELKGAQSERQEGGQTVQKGASSSAERTLWACGVCKFLNSAKSTLCFMCGTAWNSTAVVAAPPSVVEVWFDDPAGWFRAQVIVGPPPLATSCNRIRKPPYIHQQNE